MQCYEAGAFDLAVIGGGHAGIEAALSAARLGVSVILFTISLDAVGNMPCNPSIGGTAKGHLVREIDALGGEMGRAADATTLQSRMLNLGKGPAVHSLRAQCDRMQYHAYMKNVLEKQENLLVRQSEIVSIEAESGRVTGVVTALGARYRVKTVIVATGTFLKGRVFVGEFVKESGPDGMHPAAELSSSLTALGIPLRRFKTGTPARVQRRSIDFSKLQEQPGDETVVPFCFEPETLPSNKVLCHIGYTNAATHQLIRDNLHRSPLFSGVIEGIGPRYCPSIEDKVVRFWEKERHQLFVEPMGLDSEEIYLQGMSSSLPEEVQIGLYRTIAGLEKVEMMRNAYAIEYDCIDPRALKATMEFKAIFGLYGAGQFCGTSGYEEAAAQGLLAGINAARAVKGAAPITLSRQSSYIGTLIDDLITKGCDDPYRMMTSRCEYRLLLRQDNADLRLTPLGHQIGLIDENRFQRFLEKKQRIESELLRLEHQNLSPTPALNSVLAGRDSTPLETGTTLAALLRRPELCYRDLAPFDPAGTEIPPAVMEQVEISLKYEGYIKRQIIQVEKKEKLEHQRLPEGLNYQEVTGLRLEAAEKLQKVQPQSIGQASRISGVSPADISVLLIWLHQNRKGREMTDDARN